MQRLRQAAEAVLVLLMAAMFGAFILQVVFRYALNLPVGWTDEVCTIAWLWGILWGASFVMRNRDDIRFDMVYSHLPRGVRRGCTVLAMVVRHAAITWDALRGHLVEDEPADTAPAQAT